MGQDALLSVFRTTPTPSLLLLANSEEFLVFEANDAFLQYSFQSREEITGKSILAVLPPVDGGTPNEDELLDSLRFVLEKRVPHQISVDRYQVPRAEGRGYTLRYFAPKNIPVLDPQGEVAFILHTLEEVNFKARGQSALGFSKSKLESLNYRSLFDQNPDAVFSMDRLGYFTTTNRAATELIGFSSEELGRMHFSQLIEPQEVERLEKHLHDCLNGHPSSFEVSTNHREGHKLRASITIMPVVIDGHIDGIYGIAKDITEAYKLEKEKDLISRITESLGNNQWMDESLCGVLTDICSYADLEAGELWLPSMDDQKLHLTASFKKHGRMAIVETDFAKDYKSLIGRAWTGKKPVSMDRIQSNMEYLRPDFARANGLNSCISYPIIINEQTVAILALYSSETEIECDRLSLNVLDHLGTHIQKKKAEQELNQYFQMSPDMICFIGGDGYFKKVNPAFARILGYSENELLSRPYHEFIHPEDAQATVEEVAGFRWDSSTQLFENRYLTKSGEVRWLSWTATYLMQQGVVLAVARDITRSKELQKTVDLQQRRFFSLYREAPVSMCILKSKDHVFESANSLYYQLTARTPEIIGKTVREVFPELDGKGWYEWLDQVYETGKTSNWTETHLSVVTAKGDWKESYINFMYQPYLDYDGKVDGIFFFGVDVTQQVLARKKMQERKRQYINLIQNLPVAIYTTNQEGAVQIYNKAAVDLWGEEPNDDARNWSTKIRLLQEDSASSNFSISAPDRELTLQTANDKCITVIPYTIPSFDSENNQTGTINVLIDITERKLAEEQLRKLSLVATKTDNIVVITNTSGAIEWVNDAFCKFLRMPREDILGRKPSYILYETNPNYQAIPANSAIPFMENQELMTRTFHGELEYQGPRNGSAWLELNGQPLYDDSGKLSHYFLIGTNITDRKRAYETLKKSKNEIKSFARQLNTVLEEERARIAREFHDEFGQQLTGLKMSLSSLKRRLSADDAREIIEPMLSDVDVIIQHIRRFATDLRPAILDTLGLFPALEWLVRDFEKRTGTPVDFKMNVREELRIDKNLSICCFRICQEALTNIQKHSDATRVWVEVRQDEELCLSITDNGKGLETAQISDPLSMGLLGMRERAHLVGGEVYITSDALSHTQVKFSVKLYPSINVSE